MNNKQTKSFKPSGRLNSIFLWPVGLGILLVLLDILLCFVSSVSKNNKGDSGIFFQLFSGTKTAAV